MDKYTAEELSQMKSGLDANRDVFSNLYESALFYFLPEVQGESAYRSGTEVNEESQPLDIIGQKACSTLAGGIFSHTVSMDSEFFGFRTNDEELNDKESVRKWFTEASKIAIRQMANSNFSLMTYETILYYSTLNTGVLFSSYEDGRLIYQNYPITQCSISEDRNAIVNTLFRSFDMTAQQAFEKWGESCHKNIKDAYKDPTQRFTKFPFYHAVLPRANRDVSKKDNQNMPFASYYVDQQNSKIMEEGGFKSFPYAVPRFLRTSNTPYGRGSSFSALPTVREIDRLRADVIDGVELKLQPPVFMPAGTVQEDVDLTPASVNFYNPTTGKLEFYQPDIDLSSATVHRQELRQDVMSLFYADLFMMLEDRKNMSATEVNARMAEKMQAITPVINRLDNELFTPVIVRTLELLMENQVIPPIPKELEGKSYEVVYTNRLSAMLKQVEVNSALQAFQQAVQIYEMEMNVPKVGNVVKTDKLVRSIFDAGNTDPDVIYSESETEDIVDAQQEQAQMEQAQAMASEKMGQVDPNKKPEEGSVGEKLMEEG